MPAIWIIFKRCAYHVINKRLKVSQTDRWRAGCLETCTSGSEGGVAETCLYGNAPCSYPTTKAASSQAATKAIVPTAGRGTIRKFPMKRLVSAADAMPKPESISSKHICSYLPGLAKMLICVKILKIGREVT